MLLGLGSGVARMTGTVRWPGVSTADDTDGVALAELPALQPVNVARAKTPKIAERFRIEK